MTTTPGWYPDPSGRFTKRWYDGEDWTASVLDVSGEQNYDRLESAGAPVLAALPAALPASPVSLPERSSTASASLVVQNRQQPVTTASLGLTPPPPVRSARLGSNLVVYGLVALGVAGIALSMFVLDWYSDGDRSAGFRDFDETTPDSSAPLLDKLAFWNFKWLGFVVAGVAVHSVFVFVVVRGGSHRLAHVLAAIDVAVGAVLSTFVVVRLFRPDGFDPDVGAWLLPAGYLVLLLATVISARNEST